MSKPHQINVDDLKKWKKERLYVFMYPADENKSICLNCNGKIDVFSNGFLVYMGKNSEAAAKAYNSIQEGRQ